MAGQIDEISAAIGRIEGQLKSLDRYTHEREHGIRDVHQQINALAHLTTKEIAELKKEVSAEVALFKRDIESKLNQIDSRVKRLETTDIKEETVKDVLKWVFQSPLLAWLVAAALVLWNYVQSHTGSPPTKP